MTDDDIIRELRTLVKLDYDALLAYEKTFDDVDDDEIRMHLHLFRDDHQRHATHVARIIGAMGVEPPELAPDLRGVFLEAYTTIRSASTHGALEAIETGEKYVNRIYDEMVDKDFPDDIHRLIEANRRDERRHLEYVQRLLAAGV